MHVKKLSTAVMAIAISTCAFAIQANGNNWSPNQPTNSYWQTPNWGGFNMPGYNSGPNNYNRPPPGYYGAPNNRRQNNQGQNFQAPNNRGPNYSNQNMRPTPNMQRPPNPNMNRPPQNMAPPPPNMNRGYPPPQGPYNSNGRSYNDNGASAYNMPGYNRNRNNNNGWNNNKLWGRSGPSRWMNPNKGNMEDGWDDMINAPSRMGDMPGGWSAPEVTMPNPIDMGDQMQDNLQDLPDQMRDGNIGNNVND